MTTWELLQSDSRYFGQKLAGADGHYGLDVALADTLDIDEKRMSVWINFADGNRRDGVGDLLEISGINTERHQKNPIALFDHGKNVVLPIALTEDRDTGAYTVDKDTSNRTARANLFFYQGGGKSLGDQGKADEHALFCEQLYDLIARKLIRAGSIGYQVVKGYPLPPDPETGQMKGLHLLEVLMLECSVVVLPANSDTVRKALALPNVCGKPLSGYLRKSLESCAEVKKAQLGYEPKLGTTPHHTKPNLTTPDLTGLYQTGPYPTQPQVESLYGTKDALSMKKEQKSILTENADKILAHLRSGDYPHGCTINDFFVATGKPAEDLRDAVDELLRQGKIRRNYHDWKICYQLAGEPTKALRLAYRTKGGERMADKPQAPQDKPALENEEIPGEATEKAMPEEPFGATSLRQMHADHQLLMQDYARMLKLQDHPAVKKALEKHLSLMDKSLSEWESIWEGSYKDLKPIEGAMAEGDKDPEVPDGAGTDEADSEEEELPEPDEVAEEMDKETMKAGANKKKSLPDQDAKGAKPPRKTGKNPKQASAHCGQYEHCTRPNESRRYTHTKGACPGCGHEHCTCNAGEGVEGGHTPGNEHNDPEPGSEYHGEPQEAGHRPGQLHDHEMKMVGDAHHFLRELSAAPELQDTHRMDAWHHAKNMANISLAEADEAVEHNLGNHDVPPAEWQAGAGAKKLPSADISPTKAAAILKDGTVHGHELTPKQRGLFGAAASKKDMGVNPHESVEQVDQQEQVQAGPETEQMESHRKMCGKAAAFLQEVATGKDWGETHREKSQYWHKTLGGMMGSKSDSAEAAAAVTEVGSMKSLKDIFSRQDEELAALNKKLALIGVN